MSLISVIIPCYNAASTLARALSSCQQNPAVGEILVVDDGSTDHSPTIVAQFAQIDSRIRLLAMPDNGGPARARNWGALHASGEVLAFLDADDEYCPNALSLVQRAFQEHAGLAAVRLGVEFVDFPADIAAFAGYANTCQVLANTFAGNIVVRRGVYFAVGGFPLAPIFRQHGGEDGALSLALSTHLLVGTAYTLPGVRVHYHSGAHAEKFFRICMAGGGGTENMPPHQQQVYDLSMQFVALAGHRLQLLGGVFSSPRKGFAPLTENVAVTN